MPLAFNYRLDSTIDKAFLDTTMDKAFQKISFTSTQPSTNLFDVKIFVHFNSIIARAFDVNPLDQAKGYKSEISQISLECLSALSPENPNLRLCLGVLVLFLLPPNLLPPPREHVTFTGLG